MAEISFICSLAEAHAHGGKALHQKSCTGLGQAPGNEIVINPRLGPNWSFLVAGLVPGLQRVNASPWAPTWLPLAVPALRRSKNRSEYWLCLLGGAPPGLKMNHLKINKFVLVCSNAGAVLHLFFFFFLSFSFSFFNILDN